MSVFRKIFAFLPRLFCILAGCMLAGLILLVMFGEPAFSFAYQDRSPLPHWLTGCAGLAAAAALLWFGTRAAPAKEQSLWPLVLLFGLVLVIQLLIARCCWARLGWDPGTMHTTAEELARGLPISAAEYFTVCPNNAPLTLIFAALMWVAVKFGLAVPYVVLPYFNAVLLNLSAFVTVLCVRKLTRNSMARMFALVVSIVWLAFSPYITYPYSDTFSILFPVLSLLLYLSVQKPFVKWLLISLLCFFGAAIKPTVLIVLIALIVLGVFEFLSKRNDKDWWKRGIAIAAALMLGAIPGQAFQKAATAYLAGSAVPEKQLSLTHYLMLGMNGTTYGGHSTDDVAFSQSFPTLAERESANLQRAWERVSGRSAAENIKFFTIKAYKAYADGTFASQGSFLPVEIPRRTDSLSLFLRSLYHKRGQLMPVCHALIQCLWLGILCLSAVACFRQRKCSLISLLGLTLIGLTAYLLLFEVWPRYLFLYAPFFVILASAAFDKPTIRVLE